MASAGTNRARNKATSRADCGARRARRRSVDIAIEPAPAAAMATKSGAIGCAGSLDDTNPTAITTPPIQAAAASRGANARRVRQTPGNLVTLTALQITPA